MFDDPGLFSRATSGHGARWLTGAKIAGKTVTGWHPLVLLTHVVRVWVFSWSPGAGPTPGRRR